LLSSASLGIQLWRYKSVLPTQQGRMSVVTCYPILVWWETSSHMDKMLSLLYLSCTVWEVWQTQH